MIRDRVLFAVMIASQIVAYTFAALMLWALLTGRVHL